MIYGFCRISTKKQSMEMQINAILKEYPNAKIITEVCCGETMKRDEWNKLYKKLQKGDKVVFYSVSRFGRNAEECWEYYEDLVDKGISLEFLCEPYVNSSVYINEIQDKLEYTGDDTDLILEGLNKYFKRLAKRQVVLAFEQAQKELEDIRKRTRMALAQKKANGVTLGRPQGSKGKDSVKKMKALKLMEDNRGLNVTEICNLVGCSRESYYRWKREQKIINC